jgi:antirestriction protein ArdC
MSNTETYERITASLIDLIDKGELMPWQKSWNGSTEWSRSMSTNRTYQGINRWVLTLTAQANGWSPWFGTYRQIAALGGQVRKGERSTLAVFWKIIEKQTADGSIEKVPFLRTFNVFSASQADDLPEKFYAKPDPNEVELDQDAQGVFDAYTGSHGIPVAFGGDVACYMPRLDSIRLPEPKAFLSSDHSSPLPSTRQHTPQGTRSASTGLVSWISTVSARTSTAVRNWSLNWVRHSCWACWGWTSRTWLRTRLRT